VDRRHRHPAGAVRGLRAAASVMRNSRLHSDAEPLPPIPAPPTVLPRTPLPEVEELDWDESGWDALSEPTDTVTTKEER
jgi:hypothetical protein